MLPFANYQSRYTYVLYCSATSGVIDLVYITILYVYVIEICSLHQLCLCVCVQVSTWFANARRRNKKRELGQGSTSSDEGEM